MKVGDRVEITRGVHAHRRGFVTETADILRCSTVLIRDPVGCFLFYDKLNNSWLRVVPAIDRLADLA